MRIATVNEHTILARTIGPDSVVLDLGANRGRFAHEMIERFGCRCYAVEPNPELFERIPPHPRLRTFNFAVGGADGEVAFHVSDDDPLGSSVVAYEGLTSSATLTVPSKTLPAFAAEQGLDRIDLVKVDVEGAEIPMLDACSDEFLRGIGQLTFEFHDFNGVVPVADVRRVLERFERLGFFVFKKARFAHYDVLVMNGARLGVSRAEHLWVQYVLRNVFGAGRLLRKALPFARPAAG